MIWYSQRPSSHKKTTTPLKMSSVKISISPTLMTHEFLITLQWIAAVPLKLFFVTKGGFSDWTYLLIPQINQYRGGKLIYQNAVQKDENKWIWFLLPKRFKWKLFPVILVILFTRWREGTKFSPTWGMHKVTLDAWKWFFSLMWFAKHAFDVSFSVWARVGDQLLQMRGTVYWAKLGLKY